MRRTEHKVNTNSWLSDCSILLYSNDIRMMPNVQSNQLLKWHKIGSKKNLCCGSKRHSLLKKFKDVQVDTHGNASAFVIPIYINIQLIVHLIAMRD